jgi:hypothetical protein
MRVFVEEAFKLGKHWRRKRARFVRHQAIRALRDGGERRSHAELKSEQKEELHTP